MTEAEVRALAALEKLTDPEAILAMAENAKGKSAVVETAALRRVAQVSAQYDPGSVEHACWQMVHVVESVRRLKGRPVSRMNRLRPKIGKDGEIAALEYCALNRTEGFDEVMAYGMPELTAEAIVLRHPDHFAPATLAAARKRLSEAGIEVDAAGNVTRAA